MPHGCQVAPDPGHQQGRHQGEGHQVEQRRLGRVHKEEGDEGGHQAEDVGDHGDDPVQLVPNPSQQIVAVGE